MRYKFFRIIFLSLFLVISNSCNKNDSGDTVTPKEKTLTLVYDYVEPGQIVLAQANTELNLDSSSKVLINGTQIKAFDAGDNQIGFLMPLLPAGKVVVDYTNAGFPKSLDVTIKQYTPITEPETIINNFTSEIDKVILNLNEHTKNNITALNPEYIELTEYLNQTIKDNINGLSADEKIQLAYFFRSNMPNADDFTLDSLNKDFYLKKDADQNDPGEALVKRGLSLGKKAGIAVVTLTAGTALAYLPSPLLYDKIAAVGFLTVGLVSLESAVSDAEIIGKLKGVAEKILEPSQKRADKLVFAAGVEEDVYFKGSYRNLSQQDNASVNSAIASIFSSLNKVKKGYNSAVDIANKVIAWFPWKSPKIPSYTDPIGSTHVTKELNLPGSSLSISNVSNPEIKVTYRQYDSYLSVKATSQTLTKETDFTFTVKFTDPTLGIVLEKQIDASIKPKNYFLLDEANAWVIPPTKFRSDKRRFFYISEDKITKASGIDYSKITFINKSLDLKVQVKLNLGYTGTFSLILTHQEKGIEYATIEIYYDGKLVQTIAAEVNSSLSIGDSYGGGVIAHILEPGDPGYVPGEEHGLIAATNDQSTGAAWGCYGTQSGVFKRYAIGLGATNTNEIVKNCSEAGIAARICYDLELNGYTDWFLPSHFELDKLFLNKDAIGGVANAPYWSSTEFGIYHASLGSVPGALPYDQLKTHTYRVRAFRSF